MLKVLLKKQLAEIFRSFFYDPKKNKARSRGATVLWIVFFILLTGVFMGGLFAMLSLSLCEGLAQAGMGWLYYTVMGLLSLVLGVFGSVFNTYAGLYLAKDNDLLLSMPIPVRTVISSRLLGVYLMGLLYSGLVLLPAVIVYWIKADAGIAAIAGGLLLFACVSVIVLSLACALGWVVARISLKLKNKSFITVLLTLVFIGVYYFFYFKATDLIRSLLENAAVYGEKIKGAAYGLYLFGRAGEGDPLPLLGLILISAAFFALTIYVISRSFLKIATANNAVSKTKYREKALRQTSEDAALLRKEFSRFVSSPTYMLNCGLGVLLLPAAGIALLFKGAELSGMLTQVFGEIENAVPVLFCAAVCMLASMNDAATPSVSLEGASLWIVHALPVQPWKVLRAKIALQLALTLPPTVLCLICGAFVLQIQALLLAEVILTALLYVLLSAFACLYLGLKSPNLSWTDEVVPIKQSMNVMIALFGGWGFTLLLGGGYMLFGHLIGAAAYLGVFCLLTLVLSALLYRWLKTKGAAQFAAL